MTWTYERHGGLEHNVHDGQLWSVGGHKLLCADLERGAADRLINHVNPKPSLVYTDPPWGANLHSGFRAKAGLPQAASYHNMQRAWLSVCAATSPITLSEIGYQTARELVQLAADVGLDCVGQWKIHYPNGPCLLLALVPVELEAPTLPDLTGLDDRKPDPAIEALTEPGDDVIDFCAGLGATALACHRTGRRFTGSELHPNRCSATLERLRKASGQQPQLVAEVP
jgi:predicted RNA methylase